MHTGKTHTSNKAIFNTTGWLLLWGFSHLTAGSFLVSCCLYLSLCSEYRIRSVCPCLFLQAEQATAQSCALRCHPHALDSLICISHSCKFRLPQSPDAKHSPWFLIYNRFQTDLDVSSLHIFHLSMAMNGVYPQVPRAGNLELSLAPPSFFIPPKHHLFAMYVLSSFYNGFLIGQLCSLAYCLDWHSSF